MPFSLLTTTLWYSLKSRRVVPPTLFFLEFLWLFAGFCASVWILELLFPIFYIIYLLTNYYVYQFSSVTQLCPTLCNLMNCSTPGLPVYHQLLELIQTHIHCVGDAIQPSNHLILCHPLLLLPSIFPSITVFSNEAVLRIRWPNYWSFSFSISPSNEHPGLIFRMNWLDV